MSLQRERNQACAGGRAGEHMAAAARAGPQRPPSGPAASRSPRHGLAHSHTFARGQGGGGAARARNGGGFPRPAHSAPGPGRAPAGGEAARREAGAESACSGAAARPGLPPLPPRRPRVSPPPGPPSRAHRAEIPAPVRGLRDPEERELPPAAGSRRNGLRTPAARTPGPPPQPWPPARPRRRHYLPETSPGPSENQKDGGSAIQMPGDAADAGARRGKAGQRHRAAPTWPCARARTALALAATPVGLARRKRLAARRAGRERARAPTRGAGSRAQALSVRRRVLVPPGSRRWDKAGPHGRETRESGPHKARGPAAQRGTGAPGWRHVGRGGRGGRAPGHPSPCPWDLGGGLNV